MKKNFLYILFSAITLIACCISYWLYSLFANGPHIDFNKKKDYLFLFKDSEAKNIDWNLSIAEVGNKYVYSFLNYKHVDFVYVWEFKSLENVDFKTCLINQNKNLDEKMFDFGMGDILLKNPVILYGGDVDFMGNFQIDLDKKSTINNFIQEPNYKGFFGEINGMTFNTGKKNILRFNYPKGKRQTILLLYKNKNSFYVIMIESDKPIDLSILEIFNFK